MIVETIFKDKPIIVITDDERKHKRISFGINKARLILNNIEAIKSFVERNEKTN